MHRNEEASVSVGKEGRAKDKKRERSMCTADGCSNNGGQGFACNGELN